jgi:hypothetical protein
MDFHDVDDYFQSIPLVNTWEMLWDVADGAEGLGTGFESSLVDNLLIITGNDSIEQDSPILCDRCKKVSLHVVRLTTVVNLKGDMTTTSDGRRNCMDYNFIVCGALISTCVLFVLTTSSRVILGGITSNSGTSPFPPYRRTGVT